MASDCFSFYFTCSKFRFEYWSLSFPSTEMQIKTTMGHHLTRSEQPS